MPVEPLKRYAKNGFLFEALLTLIYYYYGLVILKCVDIQDSYWIVQYIWCTRYLYKELRGHRSYNYILFRNKFWLQLLCYFVLNDAPRGISCQNTIYKYYNCRHKPHSILDLRYCNKVPYEHDLYQPRNEVAAIPQWTDINKN